MPFYARITKVDYSEFCFVTWTLEIAFREKSSTIFDRYYLQKWTLIHMEADEFRKVETLSIVLEIRSKVSNDKRE